MPLWGIPTWLVYIPRRVECPEHGVVVEHLPWSDGKRPQTTAMMGFLARWARRLSWRETAKVFQTSWEAVYRSVEWFVRWGLEHRELQGVESVGLDEIHWGKGKQADHFLTVIYQIDAHCRRLLWVGRRRTKATLRRGLKVLGPEVVKGLRFICSDMWQPYLQVMAAQAGQALHAADRFHITMHLNQAVERGAAEGERAAPGRRGRSGREAQEDALAVVAPGQPSTRAGPAKAERSSGQQASDGPGLGVEGNLLPFLELQIPDLGRSLSRLLVLPGDAQSSGAAEEGRPNVAHSRETAAELVSGERRDFQWRRRGS